MNRTELQKQYNDLLIKQEEVNNKVIALEKMLATSKNEEFYDTLMGKWYEITTSDYRREFFKPESYVIRKSNITSEEVQVRGTYAMYSDNTIEVQDGWYEYAKPYEMGTKFSKECSNPAELILANLNAITCKW